MAPVQASRTYKGKERRRRHWAGIHNVLKEIKNNNDEKSITAFNALFTRNIKVLRSQKSSKDYNNKENESNAKQLHHKSIMQTDFITVNATISVQDTFLDSTFDRILAGPTFQQPKPQNTTHKSKEFSISGISTSGNHYNTRSYASESSCNITLFPLTRKTKKEGRVSKRKKKQKHFAPKPNLALKLETHENDGNKNEIKTLNPCFTSTPKGVRCKEKYETSPFLSPIPHNVDRGHGSKATAEIKKEESNSYQGPLPLSGPHVHTFNVTKNVLPEICQFGPTSTTLLVPSVVDGKASRSLCKFSGHKLESLDVAAGALIADSVIVINVPSQVQSCKADESIVSTMAKMKNVTGSFIYKDQKFDSAKQLLMNDYVNEVPINGSLSSTVHQCKNVNLSKQENRESKYMEEALYKSAEDFLGFSDVPEAENLCESTGKVSVVLSNSYPTRDSNQFSVVCNQNQVSKSGMLSSHSERLLYTDHTGVHCAQDLAVQGSEEGSWHINCSGSHPAEESSVPNRDIELLCSNVSKSLHLQESTADAYESHIINKDCSVHDSTIYSTDKGELACSSISKNDILPESSVLNSGTGKQPISVNPVKTSLRRQSCRRMSHEVMPDHVKFKSELKSQNFSDVYHISSNKSASMCRTEVMVTLPEENEEFKLLSTSEEPLVCVCKTVTARDTVLQRCCQLAPISFLEAFPTSYWLTCKKIGEGAYGEVFLSEGQQKSVLKVIPIEGDMIVNGEPQKKFEEILSEIVIAMELSGLRNGTENRTCSFSEVKRCICVQGTYPEELVRLWEDYNNCKGSENDSPRIFKENQLYIILVLAFGGCDLEATFFTTAEQSHSIFIQTSCALAVAEQVLEFEHRDLHWGNLLILPTTEKNVIFRLCGKQYNIPTKGVRVTIIDFTLSRMAYDGCSIYNDLSKDPALFTSEGDYQFEVYRLMQKYTLNSWHHFKPYTNVLWLHYLLDKMCTVVNYNCKSSRSHKQGMEMLQKLQGSVLTYKSAQDFVLNELI